MSDWSTIEALPSPRLTDLFRDDPERLSRFSLDVAGIHFDWSKTHLTADAVAAFTALADAQGLARASMST
jgi:glucose-6-phosphate isomerase